MFCDIINSSNLKWSGSYQEFLNRLLFW